MKFQKKSDNGLMKLLAKFAGDHFMTSMWTTVGSTIYVPTQYDNDPDWGSEAWCIRHGTTLQHEATHVNQGRTLSWPVFFLIYFGPAPISILLWLINVKFVLLTLGLLPLSLGLAYGRWRLEREAYLVDIRDGVDIDFIVDSLWHRYMFTWPKSWMAKWFHSQVFQLSSIGLEESIAHEREGTGSTGPGCVRDRNH